MFVCDPCVLGYEIEANEVKVTVPGGDLAIYAMLVDMPIFGRRVAAVRVGLKDALLSATPDAGKGFVAGVDAGRLIFLDLRNPGNLRKVREAVWEYEEDAMEAALQVKRVGPAMVSGVPAALTSTGLGDGGYIVEPLLLGAKTVGVHVTFLADD